MSGKVCPLCKQSVSDQLYEDITGIWKERRVQEKQLKEQRKQIIAEQRKWKKKVAEERRTLRTEQKATIERSVASKTKKFNEAMARMARQNERIKVRADKKILNATKAAERHARAHVREELKKQFDESLKTAVGKATSKSTKNLLRATQTIESTRKQMVTVQAQNMKQNERIRNLEAQLRKQTTPQLEGLLYEDQLMRALQNEFPDDKFTHTGKGGDVLHQIMMKAEACGLIVYECKRVGHWQSAHAEQAFQAKLQRKANFAILVTNAAKKGHGGFFIEKNVIVVNPGGVLAIAGILRDQILRMAELKLTHAQKEEAIEKTLQYLQGAEFKNSLEVVIRNTIEMHDDLKKECHDHLKAWKKRYDCLKSVYSNVTHVQTKTASLIAGKADITKEIAVIHPFPALPNLTHIDEN